MRDTKTGLTYYWNQATGVTTALGEPKPGSLAALNNSPEAAQRGGAVYNLIGMPLAFGFGIGAAFAVFRALVG